MNYFKNTKTSRAFGAMFLAYAVIFTPIAGALAAPMPVFAAGIDDVMAATSAAASTASTDALSAMAGGSSFDGISSVQSSTLSASSGSASATSVQSATGGTSTGDPLAQVQNATSGSSSAASADVSSVQDSTLAASNNNAANSASVDTVVDAVLTADANNSAILGGGIDDVIHATMCAWDIGHQQIGYYQDGMFNTTGCTQPSATPSISISVPANQTFVKGSAGAIAFVSTSTTGVTVTDTYPGGAYTLSCVSFPVYDANTSGVYTITCTADDTANHVSAAKSYTVTITDPSSGGPSISIAVPANQTFVKGSAGAIAFVSTSTTGVTVVDTYPTGVYTLACVSAPAYDANVSGVYTITCTAKDTGTNTTATGSYTVTITDPSSGGGTGTTTPSISSNGDKSIVKTTGTFTTNSNITINNAGSSTVTVVCTPATIDQSVVAVTSVSCVGNYTDTGVAKTTNTATYTYTVTDTTGGGGCGSNCGGSNGGTSNGGSTVGGSYPHPTGDVLGISTDEECSYLEDYLRAGWNNNPAEVLKLQAFMNVYEGGNLALNGVFDASTEAAVRAFQLKYKADVLTPWGLKGSTGFVYYTTKKKINEIRCEHEFALTALQKQEIAKYKWALAHLSNFAIAPKAGEKGTVAGITTDTTSATSVASTTKAGESFFAKLKRGFLSFFGFGKEKSSTSTPVGGSVSTSTKVSGSVQVGASCAANGAEAKTFAQKMRNLIYCPPIALNTAAAMLAILFGILAFAMAAYLYRRTRVEQYASDSVTA